jgi:hypothetical protein
LERKVCRNATRIVCNTTALRDEMVRRIPGIESKCVAIPNGYDPDVLEAVRTVRTVGPGKCVLVHCGGCYGPRSPIRILEAIQLLEQQDPNVAREVFLVFVGSRTYDGQPLEALADRFGVAKRVRVTGPLPHLEALGHVQGADATVILGVPGDAGRLQVPNKLYECIGLRKTVLALAPRDGAITDVLADANADNLVCDPEDAGQIAAGIRMIVQNRKGFVENAWSGADSFDRRRTMARFGKLLADVSGLPCAPPRPVRTPAIAAPKTTGSPAAQHTGERKPLQPIRP